MLEMIGNIGVGGMFIYDETLFVVLPFDWEEERYLNLCIATKNPCGDYEKGEFYWLDETIIVQEISKEILNKMLDK